jgi:hypothetical protein
MDVVPPPEYQPVYPDKYKGKLCLPFYYRLQRWNIIAFLAHLVQGILVLSLSNDYAFPLRLNKLTWEYRDDEECAVDNPCIIKYVSNTTKIEFNMPVATALFFFLSAFFHGLVAFLMKNTYYRQVFEQRVNYFRWIEYSISAPTQVTINAILTGMVDVVSLFMLFGLMHTVQWFGLLQEERHVLLSQLRFKGNNNIHWWGQWGPFILGCIPYVVAWIAVMIYFFASLDSSEATPPTFVYVIVWILPLTFTTFAVNMGLQYGRVGPWTDYVFGEFMYIVLSLVSKSFLGWTLVGGILARERTSFDLSN